MNICFKGIRAVNPAQNLDETVNLWIKDGAIAHCDSSAPKLDPDTEQIDGKDLVAAPGFFDMHVHFRTPGEENEEDINTGCASAANGGFTGVVCMPNTTPCVDSVAVVELIENKAKGKLVDVKVAGAITKNREGKQISEMFELNDAGVPFFTDDGSCVMCTETLKRAFDYALTRDLLIAQHCEDHTLTEGFSVNESIFATKLGLKGYPSIAESNIVFRDIETAKYIGNCRYHVMHISTARSVELVREAKKNGARVTAEVAPHHFTLDDSIIASYDTNIKMNPPLRDKSDIEALKLGLKDGTIDAIASDHAPHALHEKDVEFELAPCGIVGLETALPLALTELVHTGVLSIGQLVEKMAVNPRRICGLNVPEIKLGEQANLTVFAPNEEWHISTKHFKSKSKNSPFNNFVVKGKQKYVFNNNQVINCVL